MAVVELLRQHIMDANVAVSALSTLYVPVSLRRVAVVVCLHHSRRVCTIAVQLRLCYERLGRAAHGARGGPHICHRTGAEVA